MELRRFQRRHQRELLGVGGIWHQEEGDLRQQRQVLSPEIAACSWAAQVSFCETFDTKNPGIPSRTGDLDPNVWGVSRATGNTNFGPG